MARLRRSERPRPSGPVAFDLDDDLGRVAEAARTAAAAALGHRPDLAAAPEPVFAGWGPGAYRARVATHDPVWARPLIARVGAAPVLAREATWIDRVRRAGFPAPEVVADGRDGVLVFREPAGTSLAERMINDMASLPGLLADFSRLHATLHGLPASGAPGGEAAPTGAASVGDIATDAAGAVGDAGVDEQIAWLGAHIPVPGDPVVCHGDLNPAHVYLDVDEAVPVNWTRASLADPEYDVAATLTGFWTAALYVDSAVRRRVLKILRDSLAAAYLAAYRESAMRPLEDERLRYWRAFHLCRIAAGIVRHRRDGPDGPWDTAAHVAQPAVALDELSCEFRRVVD